MTNAVRHLTCLLCLGPLCPAHEMTVRVINAATQKPMQHQRVSVAFLYEKAGFPRGLDLETDVNGEVHFQFPEPPPPHFAAEARYFDQSRWHCAGCVMMGSTEDWIRRGFVAVQNAEVKELSDLPKPVPGIVLLGIRPASFFERLVYPILKY